MDIDLEDEQRPWAWCLLATVAANGAGRGARTFAPGTRVYCFPPATSGAYESVRVIGPSRRNGEFVSAVLTASELENWRAEHVKNPTILSCIAPPWDSGDTSRDVAEGIAQWKAGGPRPAAALREWNRLNASKEIGEGSLLTRLRSAVLRLFRRQS